MIVYSSTRQPLQIADVPFSKGGEGSVYRIPSLPKYCAKIYHTEKRDIERYKKLLFMVNHAPQDLITPNYIICWPTKLIFDRNGNFVGFVMPLAFDNSILCYNICKMQMANEISAVWKTRYNRKTKNGLINRLKILVNIAIPVHAIHSLNKYVLVDFKPQNMLITEDGKISMIDLDSVQP
jgi:DNA-binding helix-hairpin-helix protein with protein kinase domain